MEWRYEEEIEIGRKIEKRERGRKKPMGVWSLLCAVLNLAHLAMAGDDISSC